MRVNHLPVFKNIDFVELFRLGYFDPAERQPFRQLGWSDVNTPPAQALALAAASEGIVLLKNDGTLPLSRSIKKLAVIGPMANATTQMQGNYQGIAPFLVSPFDGLSQAGFHAILSSGTTVSGNDTSGFASAVAAAKSADAIVFVGGIDETVESEGNDRTSITWPGNQLALISELEQVGKPLVVIQMGGGQVDSSSLKSSRAVCKLRLMIKVIVFIYANRFMLCCGRDTLVRVVVQLSPTYSPAKLLHLVVYQSLSILPTM